MAATSAQVAPPPGGAPPPGDLDDRGAVRRDAVRARAWRAEGATRVVGDVDCERADLNGLVTIGGALTAREAVARGTLEVRGPVHVAGSLSLEGTARVATGIAAGTLRIRGQLTAGADVRVDGPAEWAGHLDARGDLRAGAVVFDGRLTIDGALTATSIDGRLRGRSQASRLTAERVVLRAPLRLGPRGELTVLRIDAHEVDLEGVVCEYVRADRIILGAGSHVARVDGTIVRQHPRAHLGPESRSPPPPGLSR